MTTLKAFVVSKNSRWTGLRSSAMVSVAALCLFTSVPACAEMPKITGTPVINTATLLLWPSDRGEVKPNLNDPTSNTLNDFHGEVNNCDLVLSTEGNYHMALHDLWPLVTAKFKDEPLHNAFYTTSPPVVLNQVKNHVLAFGNLYATCMPSVAVANKTVMDKLIAEGMADGTPTPLYKDRGVVILVKKGNPKKIHSVWDLGREDVRIVTPNPTLETGAFESYAKSVYGIASHDPHPPKGWTAEKLINVLYNGAGHTKNKWLAGARIHHRDVPWSVAYGDADAGMILYHLGKFTKDTFPDTFELVSLGGTIDDPQPLAGSTTATRFAIRLKGNWNAKQAKARDTLMTAFASDEFTKILLQHGLQRP
jgi:Bacterial extracellular solute-binding protein